MTNNGGNGPADPELNSPPVAVADAYAVPSGHLLLPAIKLLSNDSDPDGNTISPIVVTGPQFGTLIAVDWDGNFNYLAPADFVGYDTFTYKVTDGVAESAPVTVTILVTNSIDLHTDSDNNDGNGWKLVLNRGHKRCQEPHNRDSTGFSWI